MKKLLNKVKRESQQTMLFATTAFYTRMERFRKEERGDAMSWVISILIMLLLFIGVYILFKAQIDTFVKDKIFGKMNSLD
ncbi:hypothetical protein GCM10010912_58550 [Paenibacillus albidus]|uniref:Uncharacterized protein n=1 Tax=Paenibacillus albidus TaxID=2041023 RepID=A0A917CZW4_9BACL|nr:hypothetical protein [Paenibacillus albidus]GGG06222.1 hypothetical protein GCM10010912_58550 [Paenibacillus albidus]